MIEVFDEERRQFRKVSLDDNIGDSKLELNETSYYGILFPKRWCQMN